MFKLIRFRDRMSLVVVWCSESVLEFVVAVSVVRFGGAIALARAWYS